MLRLGRNSIDPIKDSSVSAITAIEESLQTATETTKRQQGKWKITPG